MNLTNPTFAGQHRLQTDKKLSYEYIRGLVEGEGCFTFYPTTKKKDGSYSKITAFVIGMHDGKDR